MAHPQGSRTFAPIAALTEVQPEEVVTTQGVALGLFLDEPSPQSANKSLLT
jgi:hypothetical protein